VAPGPALFLSRASPCHRTNAATNPGPIKQETADLDLPVTGPVPHQPSHDLLLPLDLCNKFLLAREIQFIPGCKELAAVAEDRIPDDRLVFLCTQDDTDGRVIPFGLHPVLEQPHIHIHLLRYPGASAYRSSSQ